MGVHRQQINKIENKKDVSVDELTAYAHALDLRPGDLLENSLGDLRPILPLVEQLRKFHPDALPRVAAMLSSLQDFVADTWIMETAGRNVAARSGAMVQTTNNPTSEAPLPYGLPVGNGTERTPAVQQGQNAANEQRPATKKGHRQ
jgi:transcriptional regulator with XRE-family HTH domain